MEPILAAVLTTLFVLVTAAFHVPDCMLPQRGLSARRVFPDA